MTWDAVSTLLNGVTGGWWLVFPAVGVIGVVLLAHSWVHQRLSGRTLSRLANPDHDPELDRNEATLRAELDAEAERHDPGPDGRRWWS